MAEDKKKLLGLPAEAEAIKLSSINLELSSQCNLNCSNCFRRTYSGAGRDELLDIKILKTILKDLNSLSSIDLTGWGEPLLHPDFSQILNLLRSNFSGALSFTTNGILLNSIQVQAILKTKVDIICFSIDAGEELTYQKLRGRYWSQVKSAISLLVEEKKKQKSSSPRLYASFLLRKENFFELPSFCEKMLELGMQGLILQQLTGVFNQSQLSQITYSGYYDSNFEDETLWELINKLKKDFSAKLEIIGPERIHSEIQGGCGAFPFGHLFIKANGEVSPCCALGYPALLLGRKRKPKIPKLLIFGDLKKQDLSQIWQGENAVNFRKEMLKKGSAQACQDCIGLYLRREL